jgi:hypothetical protein
MILPAVLMLALAAGQPEPQSEPAPAPQARIPLSVALDARLAALNPEQPEGYFLLGEEAMEAVATAEDRQLVVELFVLAMHLDAARGGVRTTAASACLALAELSRNERDRRWLVFVARTLDPRRVPPQWLAVDAPATVDSASYQVATLIGLVRSGNGVQARQLLSKDEVKAALEGYDSMLDNLGAGSATRITRDADRWPCSECGNARVVRRGSPPEYRLCPLCKGDPGPHLTEREYMGQLLFESLLLQSNQRSWAAQIVSDGGAPLMDADVTTVARVFGVDTSLVLWRNGRWVRDPNAPQGEEPPPPPPEEQPKDAGGGASGVRGQ